MVTVGSEEGCCAREKNHGCCRSTWEGYQTDLKIQKKKISEEKSNSKSGEGGERGYYPSEGKWK